LRVRHQPAGEDTIIWGNDVSVLDELRWLVRHTHPLCGYRTPSGDWTTAREASDFASLRDFRRTASASQGFRASCRMSGTPQSLLMLC
jgi:hypothetical protein